MVMNMEAMAVMVAMNMEITMIITAMTMITISSNHSISRASNVSFRRFNCLFRMLF